ncbi:MAG: DUF2147 domain-containing protein [Calditrichaceae bacterium]|nr:DUF2147 domain-containing protein [Calditrichaceae bacterium]
MKQCIILTIIFIATLAAFSSAQAQDIVGRWKTIDDETGKAKSIVNIYMQDGKYFGKIDTLFREPDEDPDPVCDKCPEDDPRYNKKLIGMVILENLQKDGDEWDDGSILDPGKGKVYDCKMWLEEGNLKVRGYLYFLYRTQTWYRVD